jgi:flagellar basal-body rod protein FlgB
MSFEGEARMFQNLEIFQLSHAMAQHAARRQEIVAANMANADTPGYRPHDLTAFDELVNTRSDTLGMRATRPEHIVGIQSGRASEQLEKAELSVNGNGVSLEEEMLRAVAIQRQHSRALAIYKSSLSILRTSVGQR